MTKNEVLIAIRQLIRKHGIMAVRRATHAMRYQHWEDNDAHSFQELLDRMSWEGLKGFKKASIGYIAEWVYHDIQGNYPEETERQSALQEFRESVKEAKNYGR